MWWLSIICFCAKAYLERSMVYYIFNGRHLGERVLPLAYIVLESRPHAHGIVMGELIQPLAGCLKQERCPHQTWAKWEAGQLTNTATTQAQIRALSRPTTISMEHMKGHVLYIQSCRISTAQDNNRL